MASAWCHLPLKTMWTFCIYLFTRKAKLWRKRHKWKLSTAGFTPRWPQWPRLGWAKATSWKLHLSLQCMWQGLKYLVHFPVFFLENWQGTGTARTWTGIHLRCVSHGHWLSLLCHNASPKTICLTTCISGLIYTQQLWGSQKLNAAQCYADLGFEPGTFIPDIMCSVFTLSSNAEILFSMWYIQKTQ